MAQSYWCAHPLDVQSRTRCERFGTVESDSGTDASDAAIGQVDVETDIGDPSASDGETGIAGPDCWIGPFPSTGSGPSHFWL